MDDYEEGITTESEQLCKKLLKAGFDPLEQTLFSGANLFKRTFKRIRGENETKVIRDIAPLIVPSAEILADRGEKHLEICRLSIERPPTRALSLSTALVRSQTLVSNSSGKHSVKNNSENSNLSLEMSLKTAHILQLPIICTFLS